MILGSKPAPAFDYGLNYLSNEMDCLLSIRFLEISPYRLLVGAAYCWAAVPRLVVMIEV